MARILVTDDDPAVRSALTIALRGAGHAVEETENAREALRRQEADPADLLITDLVMDEMDGIELLRRVRSRWPGTPAIAMSGARNGRIYLKMASLLGAEFVLEKPFSCEDLLTAVGYVCRQAQRRQPPP